ncbi:MAG: phosphate signaling complex protein PhoU [Lachnospiraceae bacterium]
MSPRMNFDHELEVLNADLVEMGNRVEEAISLTMKAFETQDNALAKEIIQGDRTINDMEKAIETRALSLILKQQPVAKDLRVVSTALKVVTDMERIGDHASDIAELILRMNGQSAFRLINAIPEMANTAKKMVHDAVSAFIACDIEKARNTIMEDEVVDDLFNEVKNTVIEKLQKGNEHADNCIDILMIAKYLERIGDHAVNICEWTEFHETGTLKNVRIL